MKKFSVISIELFIVLILFLATSFMANAQKYNSKKIEDAKINSKVITKQPVIAQPLEMKNTIPHFSNIQPVNLYTGNKSAHLSKLKPVAQLPVQEFNIRPASVNGTMTARDPYINSLAYIEFLSGDVLPGSNEVNCACGSGGLTYVKLVLNASAGKRYLVTTEVSPRNGTSAGLSMFSSGFVHNQSITSDNQDVSVVLTPAASGVIELWMQCSDPNGAKRKWKFHSMKVEQID